MSDYEDEDDDEEFVQEVSSLKRKKPQSSSGSKKKAKLSSKDLEKRLNGLTHSQLVKITSSFIMKRNLENELLDLLPAADVDELETKLAGASKAISKALPNSRYGSSTDHFGFKRARSATVAFKKLLDDQVSSLSEPLDLANYIIKARSIVNDATDFDLLDDNKWKIACMKKLDTAQKKALKDKRLPQSLKKRLEMEDDYDDVEEDDDD